MAKIADKYYITDPWKIVEEGFNPTYSLVSESIFSLGNEFMGVRGYFEEGYTGDRLLGSYFNGIYESVKIEGSSYKGIIDRTEFMVNSVDWLYLRIQIDGETLTLDPSRIREFYRELDLKTGILTRSYIWILQDHRELKLEFERFLSMKDAHTAGQKITLTPMNFSGEILLTSGLDFTTVHQMVGKNLWNCEEQNTGNQWCSIRGNTVSTDQSVFSLCRFEFAELAEKDIAEKDIAEKDMAEKRLANKDLSEMDLVEKDLAEKHLLEEHLFEKDLLEPKKVLKQFAFKVSEGKKTVVTKVIMNISRKGNSVEDFETFNVKCATAKREIHSTEYDLIKEESAAWWETMWKASDIVIEGDELNQQGIRYCIFQMHQTYHGADRGTIIGAKGLTGEAYSGNTFWDTETYCLPFYIFNNKEAAKNLLEFRYLTLQEAMKRSKSLDCLGAFYPIATISGRECCSLWQHASLQLQASTAVAYGIRHYEVVTRDEDYVFSRGIPVLVEICRMLASRGAWNADNSGYGYYGVMGPDEFQMMVNNNCYTNFMGKMTFEYTLQVLERLNKKDSIAYRKAVEEFGINKSELEEWTRLAAAMYIPYNQETMLFEQHEGYLKLPHIDVDRIPIEDFPLYHHWSYDRIYRNDMIKQPDVLMMLLLYNSRFTKEQLRENYEFYEPRCIHESSLSPSVHSILAAQLKKHEEAYRFFGFATRMDLDNYNRNTCEGLHTTSIAAAWMNIVYGFGGMRSDGELLNFSPSLPGDWRGYSFRLHYNHDVIEVSVNKENAVFSTMGDSNIPIRIYGQPVTITRKETIVPIPEEWKG